MVQNQTGMKQLEFKSLLRLLGYLRPYWRWVLLTFLLIFTASIARQAGPYLSKIAVDDYIIPGDAEGLGDIIAIYVGLLVLQFVISYGQYWTTEMLGQWAMRDVRMQIFSHLQRLPLKFFDRARYFAAISSIPAVALIGPIARSWK